MIMKGIDISEGSSPDFKRLKAAGYSFVIARAGIGSKATQIDKNFVRNIEGAHAAGLHVGAYWFMYFRTIPEAQENAIAFHDVANRFRGVLDMPLYMDYEEDTTRYYNQYSGHIETIDLATAALVTACSQLEKFGWYTGYYCNTNYLKRHFNERDLVHFTRWLANWSSIKPDIDCGIWQKSGDVSIPEVAGKVDLNECYVDFPTTIKEIGLNGFKQHEELITDTFFGKSVTIFKDGTWRYN